MILKKVWVQDSLYIAVESIYTQKNWYKNWYTEWTLMWLCIALSTGPATCTYLKKKFGFTRLTVYYSCGGYILFLDFLVFKKLCKRLNHYTMQLFDCRNANCVFSCSLRNNSCLGDHLWLYWAKQITIETKSLQSSLQKQTTALALDVLEANLRQDSSILL